MDFLKRILLIAVLLVTMLPCSHATSHHDHGHDVDLCSFSAESCHCHSCDHSPCSESEEMPFNQTSCSEVMAYPLVSEVLFVFPEEIVLLGSPAPVDSDVLAVLLTVQLLI